MTRLQVVCPYTPDKIEARTLQSLPAKVRLANVAADGAYYDLMLEYWHRGCSFMVVEHDIVIEKRNITSLAQCRKSGWCLYPYSIGGTEQSVSLGCSRFAAKLLVAEPDVMDRVNVSESHGTFARFWGLLDQRLYMELNQRGYKPHVHYPAVEHLHDYGS